MRRGESEVVKHRESGSDQDREPEAVSRWTGTAIPDDKNG
jgi:hypothetical protein